MFSRPQVQMAGNLNSYEPRVYEIGRTMTKWQQRPEDSKHTVWQCKIDKFTATQSWHCPWGVLKFKQNLAELHASYPSHTEAATVLRLHCDQFLEQIALDRSKVALRSQYGRRSDFSHSVDFWNVQNSLLRLFDRSTVGLLSVCTRTARTVVAVRSPSALKLQVI